MKHFIQETINSKFYKAYIQQKYKLVLLEGHLYPMG